MRGRSPAGVPMPVSATRTTASSPSPLDAIEDARAADDDGEGVAQLVPEHAENLVLGPAGSPRLGPRRLLTREQILAIALDPPALLDERGGRQDHDGHRAHEALQQKERFVYRDAGEGSGAPEHRPDRDSRQHS